MNSKYEVLKLKSKKQENIEDTISIEEPLEMLLKYKKNNKKMRKHRNGYKNLQIRIKN